MSDFYTYEQPLNERIRSFLRLEKLFKQFSFHLHQGSIWDHPVAIQSLIDLLAFTSRSDIKLEALKEIERQNIKLERLSKRPQVDHTQLDILLGKQTDIMARLQSSSGQLGQELQSIELLNAIRQKSSVPGCICDFDLPAFQFWLQNPESERRQLLTEWYRPFIILEDAVSIILDVLRQSTIDTDETAAGGFFQKSLDSNQAMQLLRIRIPAHEEFFPEISAGKHRFSVRFLTNKDPQQRPEQYKDDIDFRLSICNI